jgi:hypothetical protein
MTRFEKDVDRLIALIDSEEPLNSINRLQIILLLRFLMCFDKGFGRRA